MAIFVCFYDDPFSYDAPVPYDGICAPVVIPVESPLIFRGRSTESKKNDEHRLICSLEIDEIKCFYNGKEIPIRFRPVVFECDELIKDIPNIRVDRVVVKKTEWDEIGFDITNLVIRSTEVSIQSNVLGVGIPQNSVKIKEMHINENVYDDLEIQIETIIVKEEEE